MSVENIQKLEYKDNNSNTRKTVRRLWALLLVLYINCDIFTFFRQGIINVTSDGFIGRFSVKQVSLALAGLLAAVPVILIVANLVIKTLAVKRINIISGIVYILAIIGNLFIKMKASKWIQIIAFTAIAAKANLIEEKWLYLIYGVIEIIITVLIIIKSCLSAKPVISWTTLRFSSIGL